MLRWFARVIIGLMVVMSCYMPAAAAQELGARLRVDISGIEVMRSGTNAWTPVYIESVIGVGDYIRTGPRGRATLTFGKSLISLQMFSDARLLIKTFAGASETSFNLVIVLQQGIITQRGTHYIKDQVSYQVETPAYAVSVNAGDLDIRVRPNGQTALLSYTATLTAQTDKGDPVPVKASYGLRGDPESGLSDVLPVTSFAQLDSWLDGCPSQIRFGGDFQLNVRLGAGTDYQLIGTINSNSKIQAMGQTVATGWVRIMYNGGYGWIQSTIPLEVHTCAGLRPYPDHYGTEALVKPSDY